MKIALAMIVRGTDEEAMLLNRCLESLSPYVDGIYITRTTKPGETPNTAVGNVVRQYNGHLTDYEWSSDFADARNFSYAQVSSEYDWVMYSDADDIWRGLEKLRPTIEKHKHVDGFGFWYFYDWDEERNPVVVHRKTMIVKNDGCAKWVGAIHEDLIPQRQMEVHLVEGIDRLHITTAARSTENMQRNLEIAKKEVKTRANDPIAYWNLANSQFGTSDFEGARRTFEEFIDSSESPEEIYLARIRLANVYKSLSNRAECIRQLQVAIGLFPALPDAYLQLAYYYFDFDLMDKAEEMCLQGMVKRPQIMKMVVYNPRDYDYTPMVLLAKIYQAKYRPDWVLTLLKGCLKIYPKDKGLLMWKKQAEGEKKLLAKALTELKKLQKIKDLKKLKVALDKLPPDLQSEPYIVQLRNQHFMKTTSTGRDLVIYCGNTMHQWNPELFKTKGFGGSEEAVIHIARELAKLGWNVTVYNNCGHKPMTELLQPMVEIVGGLEQMKKHGVGLASVHKPEVAYRPFWEFNYRDKQDAVILWRWAKPLDAEVNAPKIFLDLHDVIPEGELTEKRIQKVTKIFVKSKFHRSLFPNTPDEKFAVVPNGLEIYPNPTIKKDPYLIINTSSPDRSMDVLPKLFKEVKKRVPLAKMQWAYGWEGFVNTYQNDSKKMAWMEQTKREIKAAGIEDLGRITQEEVGKLYQRATIFAYPTEFAEIDCISVKKAQAAGAYPVTTNFGALEESNKLGSKVFSLKTKDTWNRPYQFHFGLEDEAAQNAWVEMVVRALQDPGFRESILLAPEWAKQFEWPTIANRWNDELCE